MKKITGLFFYLKNFIEDNYNNNVTKRAYKKYAHKFVLFTQSKGIVARDVYAAPRKYIQLYADWLIENAKSPNTVHTYIAPVCKALCINMNEINKPIRHSTDVMKGSPETNPQGKHEREKTEFKRSVSFADMVAIRRTEMKKLKKNDLILDESGYLCVNVKKGKGGKQQFQRILPEHIEEVEKYFDGTDEKVFDEIELANKIDYHLGRRRISVEAYDYYCQICLTEKGREQMKKELIERFKAANIRYVKAKGRCDFKEMNRQLELFEKSMEGKYILRGNVRKTAIERDMSLEYDKLPMMAVSVFHLSHWRNDVTIQHYILGWK